MAKKVKAISGPISKADAAAKFAEHNQTETVVDGTLEGGVKAAPHADPDMQCQCGHCQTYRGEIEAAAEPTKAESAAK